MQSFKNYYVPLDSKQLSIIHNCFISLIPMSLSLTREQVKASSCSADQNLIKLPVTPRQVSMLEKCKLLNNSCVIELNLHQLREMDINGDIGMDPSKVIEASRKFQSCKRVFRN